MFFLSHITKPTLPHPTPALPLSYPYPTLTRPQPTLPYLIVSSRCSILRAVVPPAGQLAMLLQDARPLVRGGGRPRHGELQGYGGQPRPSHLYDR